MSMFPDELSDPLGVPPLCLVHMDKEPKNRRGLPTSKDVAALAGVSQSTVSYVMSGKRIVAPDTRKRVEAAMQRLGYHPNAGARALRGARTNVIALAVHLGSDASLGETGPYIDTIIDEARAQDYDVVLSTLDEGPAGLERLAGRRVCDAFVVMDVEAADARVPVAADLGLPVILFGRPTDTFGLDAVDFDSRNAATLLVNELAESGHKHIAVIGDASNKLDMRFPFIREFNNGALDRAHELGIEARTIYRKTENWTGILEVSDDILCNVNDRLGIITRTAQTADLVLQLLRLRQLEPGRDVSLLSMCTDMNALAFAPPVTNISPQPRDQSRLGMSILFDRLNGDDREPRLELVEPTTVTRRATTALFV